MDFIELGRIGFEEGFRLQEESVQRIHSGDSGERVFLLEHPHVFTVGRAGRDANLLDHSDPDGRPIHLLRINRGGDITYHGPGQLVGYPHLDLRRRGRDLHRYLRNLEAALIRTAALMGVDACRRPGLTGVWTEAGKLASIGVGVRLWITMHGFALNVSTDLRYFQVINPCGMPECPVTSLDRLLGRPVEMEEARAACRKAFQEVFAEA